MGSGLRCAIGKWDLKMRILLVSSGSGSRGGGEIFLEYLSKELRSRGHQVVVWIPKAARMDELAAKCARDAEVIRSEYRNTYDYLTRSLATCFNWSVSRRIAEEWRAIAPDVIHINKQNLEDGLDLLRAVRLCALPGICTIHLTQTASYLHARLASLRDFIARRQLENFEGILVSVQATRERALREFIGARAQTATVLNGVPPVDRAAMHSERQRKRTELGVSDNELLVLGVGRLVAQKRPLQFLKIAKELHEQIPQTRFLWVGDGNLAAQWQEAITRDQMDHFVSCAGWQSDVLPFFLAGDVLLHVAEFEALPFVLIEAMAARLTCVVTRHLASELSFLDEDNVMYVDDLPELVKKLADQEAITTVATAGWEMVRNSLSVKHMTDAYQRLYCKAMENAASHGSRRVRATQASSLRAR
jgi:glycosyltransferase involved in cell wall biosynthesis